MQYYQLCDTGVTCTEKVVKIQAYIEMYLCTSMNSKSEWS